MTRERRGSEKSHPGVTDITILHISTLSSPPSKYSYMVLGGGDDKVEVERAGKAIKSADFSLPRRSRALVRVAGSLGAAAAAS